MKFLKNIYFKWKLKMSKEVFMHDAEYDMEYMERFKSAELNTDIKSLRKRLKEETMKREKGEKYDQEIINNLADKIANAEAIQGEYEKLKNLRTELQDYISLL